jgi:hypothetical protein
MIIKDKIKWSSFIVVTFIVVTREDVTRFQEATVELNR